MRPLPPLACVLFDLDGTLVNTTALLFASYRYALKQVLGVTATDEELREQLGRPLADTMRDLLAVLGRYTVTKIEAATETDRPLASIDAQTGGVPAADQPLVDSLVRVYREFNLRQHDAYIRPFPGVDETLAELRRRGYPLGVVTSKMRHTAALSLRHYGLDRYVDALVTPEDTTRHKPEPEPVLLALAKLGVTPAEALFVGDSVHDIAAGQAAGVRTGAALWGPFPRAELAALRPDYLLASIRDLLPICPPRGSAREPNPL